MSPEEIPAPIVRFLRGEMESVRELETLLALRASTSARTTDSLAAIRLIFADSEQDVLRSFSDAFRIRRQDEQD